MKDSLRKILMASVLIGGVFIGQSEVFALEQKELKGDGQRHIYGGDYYATSSIREWMNSDKQSVQYTNLPPTSANASPAYAEEPGFLASFSESERNKIAVTEHKSYLSARDADMREGGVSSFDVNPFASESIRFSVTNLDSYSTRYYHNVKDKVFLLSPYQYYQFVEKRNFSSLKSLTTPAKQKYNRTETHTSWWLQAGISNIGTDNNYYVTNSSSTSVSRTSPVAGLGFVPALHLLPNSTVNGKQAKSYRIGDKLFFGSYMGEPIEWRVVNKTTTGSPMLLSEKVLDLRSFDAKGDAFSYSQSESVQFNNADIPADETERYESFDGSGDSTEPVFVVKNEEALFSRSNDSFEIQFEVKDEESGVSHIVLPNGQIITTPNFSYLVNQNTIYHFRALDRSGNQKVFALPVANINPESSVLIKSSSEGWTNKDVSVDISASNQVGMFNRDILLDSRSTSVYNFPNFTSYANKKIRVSGSMEVTRLNGVNNPTVGVGFYYRSSYKRGNDYFLQNAWISPIATMRVESLQETGKVNYDKVYEIPGNYFDSLRTHHSTGAIVGDYNYTVLFADNTYELLDNDDFGIEKIILPDGREVYQDSYRDILKSEGTYVYKVIDSRGKTTERTIEVKIDKGVPTGSHKLRHNGWVKGENFIEFTASDALSGVKELILPNGQVHNGSRFDYRIDRNGTYSFTMVDHAGNRKTESVTVTNFDEGLPTAVISASQTSWTNRDVMLEVATSDKESGVESIELPNGVRVTQTSATFLVKENGDYPFKVFDKMGNQATIVYSVTNIDKRNAIIQVKVKNEEANKVVNIRVIDQ